MNMNIPDDYHCHAKACPTCGVRYHPAESECACVPCDECDSDFAPDKLDDEGLCCVCAEAEAYE